MREYINKNWKAIIGLLAGIVLAVMVSSYAVIHKESTRVYRVDDQSLNEIAKPIKVGLVLGGGVGLDRPSAVVQNRLDTAKKLLDEGKVDLLLLSGDNRFEDYNEPQVMYDYLIQKGVPASKLQRDFAGRSTYETCERANKVFSIRSALIVTQESHIDRAVYLCTHFGIDAYGVVAEGEVRKRTWVYQNLREFLARTKAVYNVYIDGENTVLGDPIDLEY